MPIRGLRAIMTRGDASPAEVLLSGLGVSAAAASASFAGYMALTSPDALTAPIASFDVAAPPSHHAEASAGLPASDGGGGVDFTPTGSVLEGTDDPQKGDDGAKPSLQDYSVRDAFDGMAMVETRGALQLVKPGMVLGGAGRVLSIQQKGRRWIVVTDAGVIGPRR